MLFKSSVQCIFVIFLFILAGLARPDNLSERASFPGGANLQRRPAMRRRPVKGSGVSQGRYYPLPPYPKAPERPQPQEGPREQGDRQKVVPRGLRQMTLEEFGGGEAKVPKTYGHVGHGIIKKPSTFHQTTLDKVWGRKAGIPKRSWQ
ncbi:hypothetical protein AX15_002226 [Amanita polypyramis BW_CC]|nr:hypothetical protein AX15_002226 [Amanita polypyramis BW_CC]